MNLEFLPIKIRLALQSVDIDKVYEIRIRAGKRVILKKETEYLYLGLDGLTNTFSKSITVSKEEIESILSIVTERSIYAFNESIKQGYVTTKDGIRIGIAGECVADCDKVVTIKNITSLNIRVPHKVVGSADKIYKYVYDGGKINNTLIVSAPSYGKTTLLKDLIEKLSSENIGAVLVVDERLEFSDIVGENIDIIKNAPKSYAFDYGIRSMSPKVIVTDELGTKNDWDFVKKASTCGVKVIASCHADSIDELRNKPEFINCFSRYILLKSGGQAGQVDKIYDGELNLL